MENDENISDKFIPANSVKISKYLSIITVYSVSTFKLNNYNVNINIHSKRIYNW